MSSALELHALKLCGLLAAILLVCSVAPVPANAQSVYTDMYDFSCSLNPAACYPNNPGIMAQGTDGFIYGMACDAPTKCANAVVLQITPQGATAALKVLHNFSNETDRNPGLTLGPDGSFYGVTCCGGKSGLGTIFKIDSAGNFNCMHEFNGNDGYWPAAPPTLGDDGYLYGTAINYGYKISPTADCLHNPVLPVLTSSIPYYQSSSSSGSIAPLLLASDGYFYGTVWAANTLGGQNGGAVFRMTPGGAVSVLLDLEPDGNGNYTQGQYPWGGLVQGADGNFYGTTIYGGNGCPTCGVVFQLTPSGAPTVLYNFTDGDDGSEPWAGLIAASDGNLWGAAASGGVSNIGTLFSITTAGGFTSEYVFTGDCQAGTCLGARPYATPMQATSGVIYGMTNSGGYWNQGVFYSFDTNLPPLPAFVSTVQPSAEAGQIIGILGQGFSNSSKVLFNGAKGKVITASGTYLTVKVPAKATNGLVKVDGVASNRIFRIRAATTTKITTSGSPSHFGQPVTFTATITPKKGVIPDGELVTYSDGGTVIGTGTASSGVATFTTSALAAGRHKITAAYEGDGSFVSSMGNLTQVVKP